MPKPKLKWSTKAEIKVSKSETEITTTGKRQSTTTV